MAVLPGSKRRTFRRIYPPLPAILNLQPQFMKKGTGEKIRDLMTDNALSPDTLVTEAAQLMKAQYRSITGL